MSCPCVLLWHLARSSASRQLLEDARGQCAERLSRQDGPVGAEHEQDVPAARAGLVEVLKESPLGVVDIHPVANQIVDQLLARKAVRHETCAATPACTAGTHRAC